MQQAFNSKLKNLFRIFNLKLFVSLMFGSFLFFNVASAEIISSNICQVCKTSNIISPVYLAQITENFNEEKMVLECVPTKACEHVFCKQCLINKAAFPLIHYCPCCSEICDDYLSLEMQPGMIFEKSLINIGGWKLQSIACQLMEKGLLDKSLEVTRLIKDREVYNYSTDTLGECTVEYSHILSKNLVFIYLADSYGEKGNIDQANAILDSDINLKDLIDENDCDEDDYDEAAEMYLKLSVAYAKLNRLNKAYQMRDEAIKLYPKLVDKADFYVSESIFYKEIGEKEKALEYLDKSLKMAEEINDGLTKSYDLEYIALEYIAIGKEKEALIILDEICAIAESITDDDYDKQMVYLNALDGYIELNEINKTLVVLGKALETDLLSEDPSELTFVKRYNVYVNVGKMQLAFNLLKESTDIASSILDEGFDIPETLSKLIDKGSVYFQNN